MHDFNSLCNFWHFSDIIVDAFEEGKHNKSNFSSSDLKSILRIDLVLLSFKPVIDVSGDSMILKKILKEGEGAFTANEGASVTGMCCF